MGDQPGVAQRWLEGRHRFIPPSSRVRTTELDVALIPDDETAKRFVLEHHYSRSYPAARVRVGLYRRGALVGVAVYSHPMNDRVLTGVFALSSVLEGVELGRFVLLDEVGFNAESWFLARCHALLRAHGIRAVVSFSDPIARTYADGTPCFPGHIGTIYQAANAQYLGRGTPRTLRLLPDGRVLSDRTIQKIRDGSRGWSSAVSALEALGAPCWDGSPEWVARTLNALTRPLRHPGNHRYAWALDRRVPLLLMGQSYPRRAA